MKHQRKEKDIVGKFVDDLFERNDLLVETTNTTGYRNKIAYTLSPTFFSLSPLALPIVNEFAFPLFLSFFSFFLSFFSFSLSLFLSFFLFSDNNIIKKQPLLKIHNNYFLPLLFLISFSFKLFLMIFILFPDLSLFSGLLKLSTIGVQLTQSLFLFLFLCLFLFLFPSPFLSFQSLFLLNSLSLSLPLLSTIFFQMGEHLHGSYGEIYSNSTNPNPSLSPF